MSVKRFKQKVAVALIVAMSAMNVMPAAAAQPGTPSSSKKVKVTFDAGGVLARGG